MAKSLATAFAAVALIALASTAARAELGDELRARAPKTVAALLPWCPDHFKDCRGLVTLVDIDTLSEDTGSSACVIGTRDMEAATRSILDWLAQHKETHAGSAEAGIAAATKALWPC
jgi:hypothetical protein